MMALFKRQGNFISACIAIILGSIGFVLFRIYPIDFPKEIASLLLSLFGYSFGEILAIYSTKKAVREYLYEKSR